MNPQGSDIGFMHTFIRERSLSRYNCRYQEIDWFVYSDEEKETAKMPRRTKSRDSPQKVKDLNDEYSRKHFRWVFNNNFKSGDYLITLTFAQITNRKDSLREFQNWIKRLKRLYQRSGQVLKYMYVYEGRSKGTRPHYHVIVNNVGINRDDIEKLWKSGYSPSKMLRADADGLCDALCKYLTKEQKKSAKFERTWNGSTNLIRPDTVMDDNRITKKQMRKVQDAARNDEVKAYVEKIYPGWTLIDYYINTNEVTGRPFARFRLVRKQNGKGKSP